MEFYKRVITRGREDLMRPQQQAKTGLICSMGLSLKKNVLALRIFVPAPYMPCLRMWVCHHQWYTSSFNFRMVLDV